MRYINQGDYFIDKSIFYDIICKQKQKSRNLILLITKGADIVTLFKK